MHGVSQRVGRVGVHLERHVAEALAHRPHGLDVPARLDLQLDPTIALVEISANPSDQLGDRSVNADRYAAIHRRPHRSEVVRERFAFRFELRVKDGHLDRRLRHPMPVEPVKRDRNVGDRQRGPIEQRRQQVVHQHVLRGLDVFGRVIRLLTRDALTPTLAAIRDCFHDQDVPLGLDAERRLEGRHQ